MNIKSIQSRKSRTFTLHGIFDLFVDKGNDISLFLGNDQLYNIFNFLYYVR